MKECIAHGADPFAKDADNHDAIFYAYSSEPIKTGSMLLDIINEEK